MVFVLTMLATVTEGHEVPQQVGVLNAGRAITKTVAEFLDRSGRAILIRISAWGIQRKYRTIEQYRFSTVKTCIDRSEFSLWEGNKHSL